MDVTTGQLNRVDDGLTSWGSGPTYLNDQFTYLASGSGLGQVGQVTEVWPGTANSTTFPTTGYNVAYTYTGVGDRNTVTYNTSVGTQKWQYADYCSAGSPESPSRSFQTMRQLDSTTGNPTAEEFHYLYDGGGRLEAATFAMSPQTGYTPTGSNPWYDSSHHASKRARVVYDNDARSCLLNLNYIWDDVSSSWNIQAWQCGYDGTTAQKTSSATQYWSSGTWGGPTETFGYDVQRGFLTSYTSNDGASGKPTSETWGYDAAGNRTSFNYGSGTQTDSVVDNLNRATTIQGVVCNNDPLGNRTYKTNIATYVWDAVNRMTAYNGSNYSYRADGLRVRKKIGYNTTTWTYAHDGQMGFEDASYTFANGVFTLSNCNDYALGARGIDRWTNGLPSNPSVFFPIFDPHGNQVSYLSRVTNSSYWVAPQRSYDPWGNLRLGSAGNVPNGRYCASIGHENDDESTMVYMRARYYDQAGGRFISEDPSGHGQNNFGYASDDPVNRVDTNGKDDGFAWEVAMCFLWEARAHEVFGDVTYFYENPYLKCTFQRKSNANSNRNRTLVPTENER